MRLCGLRIIGLPLLSGSVSLSKRHERAAQAEKCIHIFARLATYTHYCLSSAPPLSNSSRAWAWSNAQGGVDRMERQKRGLRVIQAKYRNRLPLPQPAVV